jgi:DNA polymerase-3 subunit gamma/tau
MSAAIPSRRSLAPAIALAAALVAGCGASGPATALPSVGAASAAVAGSPVAGGSAAPGSAAPGSAAPGSAAPGGSPGSAAPGGSPAPGTPRPAGAYSLSLPSGWRSVQIGSNDAVLAGAYDTLSLPFASSLISQLTALPKSASAYAFDASDATVRSGTLVALTVTEVVLPAGVTLDDFSAVVGQQAALEAEATVPATRIQTASGPADEYVYEASFAATATGTAVAEVTQVILVAPGRGYVLTFSTSPDRAATDAPVFDKIASSIALAP